MRGTMLLLLAAVPGALLICVLHCLLPAQVFASGAASDSASPFICGHVLTAATPALPSPLSPTLVQSLVQALPVVSAALILLYAQRRWPAPATRVLLARQAARPPVPPPRGPLR
jgi:hypothetical protein